MNELLEKGHVDRGWLGVVLDMSGHKPAGALVASVNRGGPGARVGLKPGDLIVSIDGERVENPRALIRAVSAIDPGERTHLRVRRQSQTFEVAVVVGKRPPEQISAEPEPPPE